MKKPIISALFITLILQLSHGQLRHVRGMDDAGVSFSIGANLRGVEVFYQRYLSEAVALKVGCHMDKREIGYSDHSLYGIRPQVAYTMVSNKKNLFFGPSLAVDLGYEQATSTAEGDKTSGFVLGQRVGVGLEYFITSKLRVELQVGEYFFQGSKFLKCHPIYGLAIACGI